MARREEILNASQDNWETFKIALPYIKLCDLRVSNIVKKADALYIDAINRNDQPLKLRVLDGELFSQNVKSSGQWKNAPVW